MTTPLQDAFISRNNPQVAGNPYLGLPSSTVNDRYVAQDHVASLCSPAAYLVEMYRAALSLHGETDVLHLKNRRPDLQQLILSDSNLKGPVPTLSIANGVLRKALSKAYPTLKDNKDIDKFLAEKLAPTSLPYHLPFETLRHGMALHNSSFEAVAQTLSPPTKKNPNGSLPIQSAIRSAFGSGLSPALQACLMQPLPPADPVSPTPPPGQAQADKITAQLMQLTGMDTGDLQKLSNVAKLCTTFNISRDQLNEVLACPSLYQSINAEMLPTIGSPRAVGSWLAAWYLNQKCQGSTTLNASNPGFIQELAGKLIINRSQITEAKNITVANAPKDVLLDRFTVLPTGSANRFRFNFQLRNTILSSSATITALIGKDDYSDSDVDNSKMTKIGVKTLQAAVRQVQWVEFSTQVNAPASTSQTIKLEIEDNGKKTTIRFKFTTKLDPLTPLDPSANPDPLNQLSFLCLMKFLRLTGECHVTEPKLSPHGIDRLLGTTMQAPLTTAAQSAADNAIQKAIEDATAAAASPSDTAKTLAAANSAKAAGKAADALYNRIMMPLARLRTYRTTLKTSGGSATEEQALVLTGCAIGTLAPEGQLSPFDQLFNPSDSTFRFTTDASRTLNFDPINSDDHGIKDALRRDNLRRALAVNSDELLVLCNIATGGQHSLPLTLSAISTLYRVSLWAKLNGIRPLELFMARLMLGQAGTTLLDADYDALATAFDQTQALCQWVQTERLTLPGLFAMWSKTYSNTMTPALDNALQTLSQAGQSVALLGITRVAQTAQTAAVTTLGKATAAKRQAAAADAEAKTALTAKPSDAPTKVTTALNALKSATAAAKAAATQAEDEACVAAEGDNATAKLASDAIQAAIASPTETNINDALAKAQAADLQAAKLDAAAKKAARLAQAAVVAAKAAQAAVTVASINDSAFTAALATANTAADNSASATKEAATATKGAAETATATLLAMTTRAAAANATYTCQAAQTAQTAAVTTLGKATAAKRQAAAADAEAKTALTAKPSDAPTKVTTALNALKSATAAAKAAATQAEDEACVAAEGDNATAKLASDAIQAAIASPTETNINDALAKAQAADLQAAKLDAAAKKAARLAQAAVVAAKAAQAAVTVASINDSAFTAALATAKTAADSSATAAKNAAKEANNAAKLAKVATAAMAATAARIANAAHSYQVAQTAQTAAVTTLGKATAAKRQAAAADAEAKTALTAKPSDAPTKVTTALNALKSATAAAKAAATQAEDEACVAAEGDNATAKLASDAIQAAIASPTETNINDALAKAQAADLQAAKLDAAAKKAARLAQAAAVAAQTTQTAVTAASITDQTFTAALATAKAAADSSATAAREAATAAKDAAVAADVTRKATVATMAAAAANATAAYATASDKQQLIDALASPLSALIGLSFDEARSVEYWLDKIASAQNLQLTTIVAFYNAVALYCKTGQTAEQIATNEANQANLIAFLQALQQLTAIVQHWTFTQCEIDLIAHKPGALQADLTSLSLTLANFQLLASFKTLALATGEHSEQWLTALRGSPWPPTTSTSQTSLNNKQLGLWLKIRPAELEQIAKIVGLDENLTHLTVANARDLYRWQQQAASLNVPVESLHALLTLNAPLTPTLTAGTPFAAWQTLASTFQAGVPVDKQAALVEPLEETTSTALCAAYLQRASTNPDVPHTLRTRDHVYQYLLIDNQVDYQVETSQIAEAIASCQLYIHRCRSGAEDNVKQSAFKTDAFLQAWDAENRSYSTWASGKQQALYPENTMDPGRRSRQTQLHKQLQNDLGTGGGFNDNEIEAAFNRYLSGLEAISNMKLVSGYHDGPSENTGYTYFIGKSNSTDTTDYYWQRLDRTNVNDCGGYYAQSWSEWAKITAPVGKVFNDEVTIVAANDRLYLVWLEKHAKEVSAGSDKGTKPIECLRIKVSVRDFDDEWSQPKSFDTSDKLSNIDGTTKQNYKIYTTYDGFSNAIAILAYDSEKLTIAENSQFTTTSFPKKEAIYIFFDVRAGFKENDIAALTKFTNEVSYNLPQNGSTIIKVSNSRPTPDDVIILTQSDPVLDSSFKEYTIKSVNFEKTYINHPETVYITQSVVLEKNNNYSNKIKTATYENDRTQSADFAKYLKIHSSILYWNKSNTRLILALSISRTKSIPPLSPPNNRSVKVIVTFNGIITTHYITFSSLAAGNNSPYKVKINIPAGLPRIINNEPCNILILFETLISDTLARDTHSYRLSYSISESDDNRATKLKSINGVEQIVSNSKVIHIEHPLNCTRDMNESLSVTIAKGGKNVYQKNITVTTADLASDMQKNKNYFYFNKQDANKPIAPVALLNSNNIVYRTRLNSIFGAQLSKQLADGGIDGLFSLSTQQISEPPMGQGIYLEVELPQYVKNTHGDNLGFVIYYSTAKNNLTQLLQFPLRRGTLSPSRKIREIIFFPYTSDEIIKAANISSSFTGTTKIVSRYLAVAVGKNIHGPDQDNADPITTTNGEDQLYFITVNFLCSNIDAKITVASPTLDNSTTTPSGSNLSISSVTLLGDWIDFNGSFGMYFWELFYYSPLLVADMKTAMQQFSQAEQWHNRIFNPRGYSAEQKYLSPYWNVRPLAQDINWDQMSLINADPDDIALKDPMHFKVQALMRRIELLLAKGDNLYREETRDSLTEAKLCYVLALNLLGAPCDIPAAQKWDAPTLGNLTGKDSAMPFLPFINNTLQRYWVDLEQRLFRLRHNLSLDGLRRNYALFAAPADPLTAANHDPAGKMSRLAGKSYSPLYRFAYILNEAKAQVAYLSQCGGALLAAMEKYDAEHFNNLVQNQAFSLMDWSIAMQGSVVKQAAAEKTSLEKQKATLEKQRNTYNEWLGKCETFNGANPQEDAAIFLRHMECGLNSISSVISSVGLWAQLAPHTFGLATGGSNWGAPLFAVAAQSSIGANVAGTTAQVKELQQQYYHRQQDWIMARDELDGQIEQVTIQLTGADYAITATQQQLDMLRQQKMDLSKQLDVLKTKSTSAALYHWLKGKIGGLYYQAYGQALNRCKIVETSYQWETGEKDRVFVYPGAWDGMRSGLLCGEVLMSYLLAMDDAFRHWDCRAREISRTVSLATEIANDLGTTSFKEKVNTILAAVELADQTWTGSSSGHTLKKENNDLVALITLSKLNISADYPESMGTTRRIKQISVTLPALIGPYQDVQAVLSYRPGGGETLALDQSCQQAAVSHGLNDAGLFELNFGDAMYLPFEGIHIDGAGQFELRFPNATDGKKQNNIAKSLNDIVLHIRYTSW